MIEVRGNRDPIFGAAISSIPTLTRATALQCHTDITRYVCVSLAADKVLVLRIN
jgi:hypothetical protein